MKIKKRLKGLALLIIGVMLTVYGCQPIPGNTDTQIGTGEESATDETENIVESGEGVISFEYHLDSAHTGYRIRVEEISEEDGKYVITGRQYYREPEVNISYNQFKLLTAGAAMIVMYNGEEVDKITAELRDNPPEVLYHSERSTSPKVHYSIETTEWGAAYVSYGFSIPENGHPYEFLLDEEFRLTISGDTVIEPYYHIGYFYQNESEAFREQLSRKEWTFAEYYETAVRKDLAGGILDVYMDDEGELMIIEPYYS